MSLKCVIPVCLILALAVSWLAKSNDGFKMSVCGIVVYLVALGCGAASKHLERRRHRLELERMPVFSLRGTTLTMDAGGGPAGERSLEELDRALIVTTDQGPFVCDVFLVLLFRDGAEWRIASENPCYTKFYAALGVSLPLDQEQALMAICSTVNAVFPLWERKRNLVSHPNKHVSSLHPDEP